MEKVRISNSVLMDGVTVMSGCVIEDSILGDGVTVMTMMIMIIMIILMMIMRWGRGAASRCRWWAEARLWRPGRRSPRSSCSTRTG